MKKRDFNIIMVSATVLCVLVGVASLCGLSEADLYMQETYSWKIQTIAQDFVNLIIALPLLGSAVIMMNRGNHNGYTLAGGVIAYLGYTYVIYCFNVHFNLLFLLYCSVLGICAFTLLALYRISLKHTPGRKNSLRFNNVIAVYFIGMALLFSGLWMSEIIPAMLTHIPPRAVDEAGLFTNPIHVLDLSLLLPFIFITGLSILLKNQRAVFLIPVVLVFFALMSASIGTLNVMMDRNGIDTGSAVTAIMYSLALTSLLLLLTHVRQNTRVHEQTH